MLQINEKLPPTIIIKCANKTEENDNHAGLQHNRLKYVNN